MVVDLPAIEGCLQARRIEEARALLVRALGESRTPPLLWFRLGECLEFGGERALARLAYERAWQLGARAVHWGVPQALECVGTEEAPPWPADRAALSRVITPAVRIDGLGTVRERRQMAERTRCPACRWQGKEGNHGHQT